MGKLLDALEAIIRREEEEAIRQLALSDDLRHLIGAPTRADEADAALANLIDALQAPRKAD